MALTPASSSSSAASGLTALFDSTLGADATNIDTGAAGVAQTYSHLMIYLLLRSSQAATVFGNAFLRFNNDSGNNYFQQYSRGRNAGNSASVSAAVSGHGLDVPAASVEATVFGALVVFVPAYVQTTAMKASVQLCGWGETTAAENSVGQAGYKWASTAAITRVSVTEGTGANLLAGSRMTVYGF